VILGYFNAKILGIAPLSDLICNVKNNTITVFLRKEVIKVFVHLNRNG